MSSSSVLDRLHAVIASRRGGDTTASYSAKLLAQGPEACAKKLGEEAVETALAAVKGDKQALAAESADLLYHLLVLWAAMGLKPEDVYAVLAAREGRSGIAEKDSRGKRA
jgi:phosphoribosyl-ATP pyrophosphohydrolase